MWRSKATNALLNIRCYSSSIQIHQVSSHSKLSLKPQFIQNPRFFSQNPNFNNTENNNYPNNTHFNGAPDSEADDDEFKFDFEDGNTQNPMVELNQQYPGGHFDTTVSNGNVNNGVQGGFGSFQGEDSGNFDTVVDGTVDNGVEVFEGENVQGMENQDVVEEVGMSRLEKVVSVIKSESSGVLEKALDKMGLDSSLCVEFVSQVVEMAEVPGINVIGFVKWVWGKSRESVSLDVVSLLVRVIGKGHLKMEGYALWDLIKDIGESEKDGENATLLSTKVLNELIVYFGNLKRGENALEVFNKFEEFGYELNSDSYYFMIDAVFRRKLIEEASNVCEKMLCTGKLPTDKEKVSNLICGFCRGGKEIDAHLIYLEAKEKKIAPDQSSLYRLITALSKSHENIKLALDMLRNFGGDGVKRPKTVIKEFSTVIGGLCRIKDIDGAKKLLSEMIEMGPSPDGIVFSRVITGFAKAGNMNEAVRLKTEMERLGLIPDVNIYNVLMSGYVRGCYLEEAVRIWNEAKGNRCKFNSVTYQILIRGHCKFEKFDKALEILEEMKTSSMKPNADDYSNLIISLCNQALDWRTSEKLIKEMKESGLRVTSSTRALVRAVKEIEEEELKDALVGNGS